MRTCLDPQHGCDINERREIGIHYFGLVKYVGARQAAT